MPSAINTHTPIGQVIQAQVSVSPSGYLYCDGTAVSRTTYSALFAAIGTAHGIGDGSTTFNLPDLRGKFLRGVSDSTSNDPDKASRTAINGGNSGNTVGSVQSHAYESHTHFNILSPNPTGAGDAVPQSANTGQSVRTSTMAANGGSETRPINVYTNFYIKY